MRDMFGKKGDDPVIECEAALGEGQRHTVDHHALRERMGHVNALRFVRPPPPLSDDRTTTRQHKTV